MLPDLQAIQDVFFEAMASGYAKDAEETTIMGMPGSKAIPFEQDGFRVLDCYFVSQNSQRSAGTTTIWHNDQPVWMMHYGGFYEKSAIWFLKKCLYLAYVVQRQWFGGRGPKFVRDEPFIYQNLIHRANFADFEGEERIYGFNEHLFGYHWYRGMLLINV